MQDDEILRKVQRAMLYGNIGSTLIVVSILLGYVMADKMIFTVIAVLGVLVGAYINIRFVRCPVCERSILKLPLSATHCSYCGTRIRIGDN